MSTSSRHVQRPIRNWERLCKAVLQRQQLHGNSSLGRLESTPALGGSVPSSLGHQSANIDAILQVANEIQSENPNVSRILCEHAYSLSQDLDPNSEGRGVLQFKTGLMSVIKQKLAKKDGEGIDRSQDVVHIEKFYKDYRKRHNIRDMQEEQQGSSPSGRRLNELERSLEMKKAYAVLGVLKGVVDSLPPDAITAEFRRILEADAAKTEQFKAYNILPLGAPGIADGNRDTSEILAAMNSLDGQVVLDVYVKTLPNDFEYPHYRRVDVFDLLEYIFGFQRDNASNQREHFVLLLASAQSHLYSYYKNGNQGPGEEVLHQLDENAINKVCEKVLDNYIKWCDYLQKPPFYRFHGDKQTKLLLASLYLLVWGEAANVRFLPECLCYIFHRMADELLTILNSSRIKRADSCQVDHGSSFLNRVILPIYMAVEKEASANRGHGGKKVPHSKWRNYDDFNEYFWSSACFELQWPLDLDSPFFSRSKPVVQGGRRSPAEKKMGKSSFVEHRSFVHIYHSFHRLWIFLVLAFQGLAVIAFSSSLISMTTLKGLLSLAPTFLVMKFIESILDILLMVGAYRNSPGNAVARIFIRFFWFGALSVSLTFLYVLVLNENSRSFSESTLLTFYTAIVVLYIVLELLLALFLRVPTFRDWTQKSSRWGVVRFLKWMHQEQYYVGRGLYEKPTHYLQYVAFWVLVMGCKFPFTYFLQIKPLVTPTRTISGYNDLTYTWHDFISQGNHNALTIAAMWAPVIMIYLLDIQIWYTILSSVVGGLIGTNDRLGEIRSLESMRSQFHEFPQEFGKKLIAGAQMNFEMVKYNAARFASYWNQIITALREEDYISNREKDLLVMPPNVKSEFAKWPLFLLVSKVFLAAKLADEHHDNQRELSEKIKRDKYMLNAVEEVYQSFFTILSNMFEGVESQWVSSLRNKIENSIVEDRLLTEFRVKNIQSVLTKVAALLAVLGKEETPEQRKEAVKAMQDLYDGVTHDLMNSSQGQDLYHGALLQRMAEGRLFSNLRWPAISDDRDQVRRLHMLLTFNESAASVPKNLEARRRLLFFSNSLFMNMPKAVPVREMRSFSVFTPYYKEDVLYTNDQLQKQNKDGISTLFYLQKIFKDEWSNFLERVGIDEPTLFAKVKLKDPVALELRLWASYRGQTLARTVRGMMYYRRALLLQGFLESQEGFHQSGADRDSHHIPSFSSSGYLNSSAARAQADLKFTYVVSCQVYGQQKQSEKEKHVAADILYLMQRNDALRVAYIDTVEVLRGQKTHKEYFSKLVKADLSGKDQEIYKIKLPGNPLLGEGKPENQNHAIIFTRGEAVQTIDMNQDNYFEEALKMRNLLEEFVVKDHGLRLPTILGVREHVFTGSVSSLAWFMSNQEGSFVTLGQRVLARPLKVRMHYGHPDVFDRVFHITRGGISKASQIINISEDIYAGFNSTLRQGNITHHEYIQVGKGRDVGLNQIAMFEGKVAAGNGEQALSRDVYRLGQLFDFFRMLSFYVTSVGFYVCTMMTVLTVYAFLYGKAYLALSGVGAQLESRAQITSNAALQSALETQFLFQIGIFTAIPMIMGFILEQGPLKAVVNFVTMQLQLASVFFTFSLGTRTHYFGRTLLHGGAKYRATGRGFVVEHIKFAEIYRLFARSHFVKGLEIVILLLIYLVYGFGDSTLGYILLSFSSWFLAISWLYAPFIFNPSGFEWQKTVEDFGDWTNWLLYKGGVGVKGEESWETWWDEEQSHIQTLRGKILETLLSLRFFFFQYGVVYRLHAADSSTSLRVYGVSWLVLIAIVLLFKIFTFSQKTSVNFQMFLRLFQGTVFVLLLVALALLIVLTALSFGDIFASLLALIPTGWAILSIAITWKPVVKRLGLWKSIRTIARFYDAAMGMVVFFPIALLSWFPFVSTFQNRLLFNQAFSRGLEISQILSGKPADA
ncbi:hypothetical protein KP509_20G078000 [Ceratopteris richardii]|uniref:1,3-beta-glucan synthase n=1 Tax=Ceratopteris richardii TaxID=49495 RepID=A0A8T2SKG8_CERRI|nr:hypothetical protein KP509_20G078000 [Ceratopteris richardii]